MYNLTVTCHCVPGSLRPGFIASQVLCVCNFYATFFATSLQRLCNFFCNCFFPIFCTHKIQLFATLFAIFCNLFCNLKKVAKKSCKKKSCNKLAKSCKKKELHSSCKHIEPGTQRHAPQFNNLHRGQQVGKGCYTEALARAKVKVHTLRAPQWGTAD